MWPTCRSAIAVLLFSVTALAAAPPRVLVSTQLNLPLTWQNSGVAAALQHEVTASALAHLRRFGYIDWTTSGPATQAVVFRIDVEEDGAGGRPTGYKPWRLRMTLTSMVHSLPAFVSGITAHVVLPRDDDAARSKQIVAWIQDSLAAAFRNDAAAEVFVQNLLRSVVVADEIRANTPNVLVRVPYTQLSAKEGTWLRAQFVNGTTHADILVRPEGSALQKDLAKEYTDCQRDNPSPAVAATGQPATVTVWSYYGNFGTPQSGDTMLKRGKL